MIQAFFLPKDGKESRHLTDLAAILDLFRQKQGLLWVDFSAPTPEETAALADGFGFHPVAVQTCREVNSQPLVHSYDSYLFMVIHAVNLQARAALVDTLEVDIFWGKTFVLTYHQVPVKSISDMLDMCATRALPMMGRGADFLMHAIVDKIIDNFSPTLDSIECILEELEIQIFQRPTDAILHRLLDLRQTLSYLVRVATAQRDVVGRLLRGEFAPITKQAMAYWHEAYDHLSRMVQTIEAHRELLNAARDTYLSIATNRTNEILKVMTIIATVFMPITFIAAVYGMNFKNMPEVEWRYGYAFAWTVMILVTGWMLWFFRRRKWI